MSTKAIWVFWPWNLSLYFQEPPTLRLRLQTGNTDKKVSFNAGTIDNEHMNKKKSKCKYLNVWYFYFGTNFILIELTNRLLHIQETVRIWRKFIRRRRWVWSLFWTCWEKKEATFYRPTWQIARLTIAL